MSATTTRDLTRKQATQFLIWYGYMPDDVERIVGEADRIDQFYEWHPIGLCTAVMLVQAHNARKFKFRIKIDTTGIKADE